MSELTEPRGVDEQYEQSVVSWICEQFSLDPTLSNGDLAARAKKANGTLADVIRLRAVARKVMGIERTGSTGTIEVVKWGEVAKTYDIAWTEELSQRIRALGGWKLPGDPFAPPEEEKPARLGRRRVKPLEATLQEAETAGDDQLFGTLVAELRRAMNRLDIQTISIDLNEVVISRKVKLDLRKGTETAPPPLETEVETEP